MSFTFGFATSPAEPASGSTAAAAECFGASCEHAASELEAETDGWPDEPYGFELRRVCIPPSRHEQLLGGIVGAEAAGTSDLVSGEYEGGFKVWECAHDIMAALDELRDQIPIVGATVLEAGCGAGLPGALALRCGCASVVFQDYNGEVLSWLTMPTLKRNGLWSLVDAGRARFVSGDWSSVSSHLSAEGGGGEGFDLILSSDCIYSTDATARLWRLLTEQLRKGGSALLGAKSYYFGVGGSVAHLRTLIDGDGRFTCDTVRTFEDGKSNRREVLLVRWR